MKKALLALLLVFTMLVSSTIFTACDILMPDNGSNGQEDDTDLNRDNTVKPDDKNDSENTGNTDNPGQSTQPGGSTQPDDPDVEPHTHFYEYILISNGELFALEGHCVADGCTDPTVIVDEGLIPEYEYIAANCTQSGLGIWSYTKDGRVYTLKVEFPPVADNHTYDGEYCVHCGAEKPADQPTAPEHTHSWVDATCITPKVCSTCGVTSGNALGHSWIAATCTVAKTCSTCGSTSGSALDHSYTNGSCTSCGVIDPDYVAPTDHTHTDSNNDDKCDTCYESVVIVIDFYAINDLHGKFCDTDTQPGVDELGTYLQTRDEYDDNVIILSSGDMWQGAAESNLTNGLILTEWMNAMGFASMTIGNHEYDWGEEMIRKNLAIAEFPFLAINIYDTSTGKLVDYCTPSVIVDLGGIQVGIIGAVGDCYSSISSDMVSGVEFKVGSELTSLVKAESVRLKEMGADLIVYSVHDGDDNYDSSLSNGYVDVVFEGHTHSNYVSTDSYGVYHLQGGGENKGICHVEISLNYVTDKKTVTAAEFVSNSTYQNLPDDPTTEAIEEKYSDIIDMAYSVIGYVSTKQSSSKIEDIVAELYLSAGIERWGDRYNIVLGGGYINTRSPYDLAAGNVTYSDILSLLPFDNQLVLCSIKGTYLKSKFINTTNSNYHNAYSEYYDSIKNSISNNATYYVIVDTYTAFYAPNNLTIVDYYDDDVFARDLLAAEVKAGRFDTSGNNGSGSGSGNTDSVSGSGSTGNYTLTSIPDAIAIGKTLGSNKETSEIYYIKGTIVSIDSTTYGNCYIKDEEGNQLLIYGMYDTSGNRYDAMSSKPKAGDTIVVCGPIYNYKGTTVEIKNATLISVK